MIADLIAALVGPLGGLLAGIVAVLGAFLWGQRKGTTGERERRAGQDARDYRDTRKEIDNADLGHGATDSDRINRLREIAGRRGGDRKD